MPIEKTLIAYQKVLLRSGYVVFKPFKFRIDIDFKQLQVWIPDLYSIILPNPHG